MTPAQRRHEDLIERARQDLLSAQDGHTRRVAADHFRNLCRMRDPLLIHTTERARLERAHR